MAGKDVDRLEGKAREDWFRRSQEHVAEEKARYEAAALEALKRAARTGERLIAGILPRSRNLDGPNWLGRRRFRFAKRAFKWMPRYEEPQTFFRWAWQTRRPRWERLPWVVGAARRSPSGMRTITVVSLGEINMMLEFGPWLATQA